MVADGSVRPDEVVVIEEWLESHASLVVGEVGAAVGPLTLQGLVEGLGLAVGLGLIGLSAGQADGEGGGGFKEGV